MITVRSYTTADWPTLWQILEPVFRAGETYAWPTDITAADACRVWTEVPAATYVACDESGTVCGSYYLKPNQPGPGSHVCNCGYVVAEAARGQGIASMLCEHSQQAAVQQGFRAMQYNLVVASNAGAVRLWKRHGFRVIGTLPEAFQHRRLGFVDALVMYKLLSA